MSVNGLFHNPSKYTGYIQAASFMGRIFSQVSITSRVLQAMGLLNGRRCAPLRLSMGRYTRAEEIERVLDVLPKTVARLRG